MKLNIRPVYFYLFAFALLLTGVSFILQYGFHLEPCPLCILDRIIIILLTVLFALGLLHSPPRSGQYAYASLALLLSIMGILVTIRHLWMLHLPPAQVPDCGPGFAYLMESMPFQKALMIILKGSGECGQQKNLQFLGLSLPGWTLFGFLIIALGNSLVFWGKGAPIKKG